MTRILALLVKFRTVLLPLISTVVSLILKVVEGVRDFLDGDVAKALAQFDKANGKLDRARMAAVRRANKIDDQIEFLLEQIDNLEDAYDATIGEVERASRVQARLTKLLN